MLFRSVWARDGRGVTTRGVGCTRGQLPMFGRSSVLLPGKSVGIRQRYAAVRERIRRRRSTVLGSVPARSYGIGLWQPGPSLQHSQVVARLLGVFQDIGWSPGHNHGIAEVPSLGCGSLHLPPERVDVVSQGVAWLHGSSHGVGGKIG